MALETDRSNFLNSLRTLGGSAGYQRLREQPRCDEDRCASVKDALIAANEIVLVRGRRGCIVPLGTIDILEPPTKAEVQRPARVSKCVKMNGNSGDLGIEADLFKAAYNQRGNPSDHKYVALGLMFINYISDSFDAKPTELLREYPDGAEDPDEYAVANVFWVQKEARWSHLRANVNQNTIGAVMAKRTTPANWEQ